MTDADTAFDHPGARLDELGTVAVPDRILLRDHVVEAEIGAFQGERGRRQRLAFDIAVEVEAPRMAVADDVDRILSYDRLLFAIDAELKAERLNLLETLAERIAARILAEPAARRVILRIRKLDLGAFALGVEIVRSAGEAAGTGTGALPPPAPLIVHLTNARIAAPELAALLDALEAEGAPVVLTVDAPDAAPWRTGHAPTERRIALLMIEANAWALAARDPRCVVVASRTELDWAARQGRMVVWAPGKMLLDTKGAPRDGDAAARALWLGRLLGAREVRLPGAAGAGDGAGSVPIRRTGAAPDA